MWPALAIIAASMFAKHMANQGAVDRQNQLQQAMATYQRSRALQNEAATKALISQQTPDARATELKNIDTSRQASMQGTVDTARAASPVTQAAGTNTSGDYQRASTAAADTVAARTKKAIEQLGLMGAPGEQGIASGIRFGRAAGDVDAGNAAIANVGAGYMRDISNVRPNPWLSMAGDIGMGVGGGMAGNYLGSPADIGTSVEGYGGAGDVATTARRSRLQAALSGWGFGR
jgi:hypothetical protein